MTQKIPVNECGEVIDNARQILNDEKIGRHSIGSSYTTFLSNYRDTVVDILKFGGRNGYLTKVQLEHLTRTYRIYQNMRVFISGFEEELREPTVVLLEEVAEFTKPYVSGDRGLQTRQVLIRKRAEQIRDGEYFWNMHLGPAERQLDSLKDRGVDVKDLVRGSAITLAG